MYNYKKTNFNPYLAYQMGISEQQQNDLNNNNNSESESESCSSSDSVDEKKVEKKRKKYKHRVTSKIKPYGLNLFGVILLDLGLIISIFAAVYVDPRWLLYIIVKIILLYLFSGADDMIFNILKDSVACDFVDNIRQNQPKPRYGIECYHNVRVKSGKNSYKNKKVVT